jgi:hypothetical protein
MDIRKLDLTTNKFNMKTLKDNIYNLNLLEIIETQVLTKDFIIKYILNKDYQLTKEEMDISIKYVLKWQKHINKLDLLDYNIKRKDSFTFEDYCF